MGSVKASHNGRQVSTKTVLAKTPEMISIPIIPLDDLESIATGFRQESITCEDGAVLAHGGWGSPFAVSLEWKGRKATISAQALLAAWVRTFNSADADAIEKANIG